MFKQRFWCFQSSFSKANGILAMGSEEVTNQLWLYSKHSFVLNLVISGPTILFCFACALVGPSHSPWQNGDPKLSPPTYMPFFLCFPLSNLFWLCNSTEHVSWWLITALDPWVLWELLWGSKASPITTYAMHLPVRSKEVSGSEVCLERRWSHKGKEEEN